MYGEENFSLLQVIIYLFFSSKASMFQNLSQIREELGTLSFPDVSKQALSKARQFINPSLFKELYYLSVDLFLQPDPFKKAVAGLSSFCSRWFKDRTSEFKINF